MKEQCLPSKEVEGPKPSSRFIPVAKWNDHHPWPPVGGLRWLIFHEKSNGFSKCVVRVGRNVLIDEDAFVDWMRSQKGGR